MPVENTANFVFFLLTMKAYQFDIENVPFVSDRGHLLVAVRFLYKLSNIFITIKFCLEHILRNVIGRYEIPKEKVSTLHKALNDMQSASTYDRFCKKNGNIAQNGFVRVQ